MIFLKDIYTVINKDIITEMRTKEIFLSMVIFALLVIIIFNFAFDLAVRLKPSHVAHGVLWVAFTFGGIIGLNRSFLYEKENECIQGLLLTPADRSALYLGKMASNLIFMAIMEIILLPFFVIFFNINIIRHICTFLLIVFLGTLGFISVGTLFSAISVNIKTREIMLPVLLFPIIIPVMLASVKSTEAILNNKSISTISHWIQLLVVFDIIFIVLSLVAFEYVIEE